MQYANENVKKSNILGTCGLRVKWQNTWRDKPQEKQQIVSTETTDCFNHKQDCLRRRAATHFTEK